MVLLDSSVLDMPDCSIDSRAMLPIIPKHPDVILMPPADHCSHLKLIRSSSIKVFVQDPPNKTRIGSGVVFLVSTPACEPTRSETGPIVMIANETRPIKRTWFDHPQTNSPEAACLIQHLFDNVLIDSASLSFENEFPDGPVKTIADNTGV